jgi:hypothetical protein
MNTVIQFLFSTFLPAAPGAENHFLFALRSDAYGT